MAVKFNWKQSRGNDWLTSRSEGHKDLQNQDGHAWMLMSLVLDGEASESERQELDKLMSGHPQIASQFSLMQSLSMCKADIPLLEPPAHLREAILQATVNRQSVYVKFLANRSKSGYRYALPAGSVAAIAFAALVFAAYMRPLTIVPTVRREQGASGQKVEVAINLPRSMPAKEISGSPNLTSRKLAKKSDSTIHAKRIPHRIGAPESIRWHSRQMLAYARIPVQQPAKLDIPAESRAQPAASVAHSDTPAVVAYSPRPMMDVNSQRSLMARVESTSIPWSELKSTDEVNTSSEKSAANASDNKNEAQPSVRIRTAHLILSQLPPDSRGIQTSADFKKLRDAANQGYDRDTMASIQRGQATVKLVGRF